MAAAAATLTSGRAVATVAVAFAARWLVFKERRS